MSRWRRARCSLAWRRMDRQLMKGPVVGSWPSMTFSATERLAQRLTSWKTTATPPACACAGPEKLTSLPSTSMRPAVSVLTPVSALMSVDFPAPFSPMRAWTSPG